MQISTETVVVLMQNEFANTRLAVSNNSNNTCLCNLLFNWFVIVFPSNINVRSFDLFHTVSCFISL